MLEQGEKQSLAQAFDGIQKQFHVSDQMLGGLAAAMVLVGVVGGMPIGALADRWKRGLLLVIAIVIWTSCMGLGAIAPSFAFLFITRLGVGAVEANGPASFSLMSDYYAVEKADLPAVTSLWREPNLLERLKSLPGNERKAELRRMVAGSYYMQVLVGTPDQIADRMLRLSGAGIDGLNMTFVDYANELQRIIRDVLPLLEQAGLRRPFASQASG